MSTVPNLNSTNSAPAPIPPLPRAPLSIWNVRRTLKEAFGDTTVVPASSRPTRHREEDH